ATDNYINRNSDPNDESESLEELHSNSTNQDVPGDNLIMLIKKAVTSDKNDAFVHKAILETLAKKSEPVTSPRGLLSSREGGPEHLKSSGGSKSPRKRIKKSSEGENE